MDLAYSDRSSPEAKKTRYTSRPDPLVVVSYAWSSPAHPDPDGWQLHRVLGPAIEWYMSERAGHLHTQPDFEFGTEKGWWQARGRGRLTEEELDFGIFIDYSSMWQKPRSAEQDGSFGRALSKMDLLYGHQQTVKWRMTQQPPAAAEQGVLPYAEITGHKGFSGFPLYLGEVD